MSGDELTQLERDMFRAYHSDGAMETFLGIGFLLIGWLLWEDESFALVGLFPVYILFGLRAWKKRITHPRLGFANWSEDRRNQIRSGKRVVLWSLAIMVAALLVFALLQHRDVLPHDLLGHSIHYLVAPLFAIALSVVAATRYQPHFYGIAALGLILMLFVGPLHLHLWGIMLILGVPLVVIGLVRVYRFVKQYPVMDEGDE